MKRWLSVLFVISCGPHTVAQPSHVQEAPTQRDDRWAKLSFEDRHSVMTFTVLPNIARTWRDFRHTADPEMTCRTCHGQDAESVDYRMPNPALAKIDPAHPPAGPVAAFMKEKMVPEMIDLVGTTPEHFSCKSCHPK